MHRINFKGGPKDGETREYPSPLPNHVVFQQFLGVDEEGVHVKAVEYEQVPDSAKGVEVDFKWRPTE